jgi:translation initiation factor 1
MAKLTSLSDLQSLLSEEDRAAVAGPERAGPATKTGYDGRPQKLDVRLDTKRRRGKTVTLITGFQSSPAELDRIANDLKKSCGAGGTVADNAIEIQGDHRARVVAKLKSLGFDVKG